MATLTMSLASRMRLHEKKLLNAVLTIIESRHPDMLDESDLAAINEKAAAIHAEIETEIAKQQDVSTRQL